MVSFSICCSIYQNQQCWKKRKWRKSKQGNQDLQPQLKSSSGVRTQCEGHYLRSSNYLTSSAFPRYSFSFVVFEIVAMPYTKCHIYLYYIMLEIWRIVKLSPSKNISSIVNINNNKICINERN